MSERFGKLVSCTRCPKDIFLERTGEVGLSNLAGPGMRSTYEDLPKTWMYIQGIGYLCPDCAKKLVDLFIDLFGEEKYHKFAPCWKVGEEIEE